MSASAERGFSLLEVLVATALTIGVLLAATSAVANALHGAALAAETTTLRDDALNVLSDLRAVTAYDDMSVGARARLGALVGRSASMQLTHADARAESISVSVSQPPARAQPVAEATVTADGMSVTERATLYVEAPEPGSSVRQ